MKTPLLTSVISWRSIVLPFSILSIVLWSTVALSAGKTDPEAEKVLRAMAAYMGKLTKFSVDADVDSEIIDLQGQKLQFSSGVTTTVNRPNKFHLHKRGAFADAEFFFDGKTVTIFGKKNNAYVQVAASGKIENAFQTVQIETGLDAPAADLFYADPYPGLMTDVSESNYIGTVYVNGVECHYIALRASRVDSQIWIKTGKKPLPMKYIVTSKWITGAPQYSVRFRNWKTEPKVADKKFKFVPSKGAKKLDSVPVNEIGEMMLEEIKK